MRALLATVAVLAACTSADAVPITLTLDYDLTGPASNSPPTVFNTATVAPPSYNGVYPNPTLTATTSTATGNVTQSGFGLGVRSGAGFLNLNREPVVGGVPLLGASRVDNIGNVGSGTESLSLTISGIHPDFTDTRVTALTFGGVLDPDAADDIEIFLNGNSQGTFNFAGLFGGVLTLGTPIFVSNGDSLTFQPVNGSPFNGFGLAGLQLQAEVPEPATLAVFGGIAVAGLFGYRRRKVAPTTAA